MRRTMLFVFLAVWMLWVCDASVARDARSAVPPARLLCISGTPADTALASIDGIIRILYDVISGTPTQPRDWDRFRSLFHPAAKLVAVRRPSDSLVTRVYTPEDFVAVAKPSSEKYPFSEREIARSMERFGAIAHVWSTYETQFMRDGVAQTRRGINSIQLFRDTDRWWILSIFWDDERPGMPIPKEYLPRDTH